MRRTMLTVVLAALLCAAAAGVYADSVKVDVSTQLTASVYAVHWTTNPSVVYRPANLGFGAGVKTYVGLGYEALFIGPYARFEAGPFYFGAGPLFLPVQPTDGTWATVTNGVSFIGLVGLHIPIVPIGPGRLGIDTGIDISITPSPIIESDTGNIIADILSTIVTTALGGVVNATKVNIGVYYSFGF